jgi:hypothetical protein
MKKVFSNIINPFMSKGNNPFMQVGIAKWYNGNKIDLDMES